MGRIQVNFQCSESFKNDLEDWADEYDLSVSEYLREAARQKAHTEQNHE